MSNVPNNKRKSYKLTETELRRVLGMHRVREAQPFVLLGMLLKMHESVFKPKVLPFRDTVDSIQIDIFSAGFIWCFSSFQ